MIAPACIEEKATMNRCYLCLSAALVIVGMLAPVSRAQSAEGQGITVSGAAEVKIKPNQVVIGAVVSGEAELTNDAMVKYRDAKKRAMAAIEGLKLPNVKIEAGGVSVSQAMDPNAAQMMMQGRAANVGKSKVRAMESLKITISEADKSTNDALMDVIMKLIDAGRDAGLQIGSAMPSNWYQYQMEMQNGGANQNIPQFKVTDVAAHRDEAFKKAMDDAKTKAQHLADLAGVKLGRILSIHASTGKAAGNRVMYPWMYNGDAESPEQEELTSGTMEEIPLKVTLNVQYEIQK
jgi:uncharacterized protein YggE